MVKLGCKLYAISLHRFPGQGESAALLSAMEMNHFSFFQKEAMAQFLGQFTAKVAAKARVGTRTSTEREEYGDVFVAHCFAACDELGCVVVGDRNYPYRVAFDIATLAVEQFLRRYTPAVITGDPRDTPFPELQQLLDRYQKPEQADSLLKMRRELVETTQIMHGNMNAMLDRGDKVENLVRKSDILNESGKLFKRVVKKRAPTPPRDISDKIKLSFALVIVGIVLVIVVLATNQLLVTKVYPQKASAVDNIAATFGMLQTCYVFTFSNDSGERAYCTASRALGGSNGCTAGLPSSGTMPSFLGLIMVGMYLLAHLIAFGFSVCISRRPDSAKQFAGIALVLVSLSTISLAVATYTWATAYSNPYFASATDWCVLDGDLGPVLHNVTTTCASSAGACSAEVNWGYSSFILWLGLGCCVGVLGCQVAETWSVLTSDPLLPEERFLSKQYEAEGRPVLASSATTERSPLLVNDGDATAVDVDGAGDDSGLAAEGAAPGGGDGFGGGGAPGPGAPALTADEQGLL